MPIRISVPNLVEIGQTVAEISHLMDFQDGSRRHLEFSKFQNVANSFLGRPHLHHPAIFRRDWPTHRGDIEVFRFCKMASVRHLGFRIVLFLGFIGVGSAHTRQCAKFGRNWLNGCGDIAV